VVLLVGLVLWIGVFMTEVALKPLADGIGAGGLVLGVMLRRTAGAGQRMRRAFEQPPGL
jgi:hypothetical protein